MIHLTEIYENNFTSKDTFNAEDNKPFKFGICVEVMEVEDNKYMVIVSASKLPKYLTKKQRQSIASGLDINTRKITVNDVCEYGFSAHLNSYLINESDIESKLNEIDNEIPIYSIMCGFYFDKANNRMGKTGWDFMSGNN